MVLQAELTKTKIGALNKLKMEMNDNDGDRKQSAKAEGIGEGSIHGLAEGQCHCAQTQRHLGRRIIILNGWQNFICELAANVISARGPNEPLTPFLLGPTNTLNPMSKISLKRYALSF